MIQFSEVLADAYVLPARNVALPSLPGRRINFLQGHAAIKDGRDLAAMLRRPDVKVVLTDYAHSWIDQILKAAGPVRAELHWPAQVPDPNPEPEPTPEPEPEPEPVARRHNAGWDLPRDPKTGRILPRNRGPDGVQPGT